MSDVEFIKLSKYAKDITEQRFGRLVALGPVGRTARGQPQWLCRCDCGNTTIAEGKNLRFGFTQSCGCLRRETTAKNKTIHGGTGSYLYQTWINMIGRCEKVNSPRYKDWGGRGIKVCDEWRHNFETFRDFVRRLPHCEEKGYSLDRIDNDKDYEPSNIKWSTAKEQNRNKRHTRRNNQ